MLSLSFSAFQAWSFSFLVGVRFFCLAAMIRRNPSMTSLSDTLTLCLSSCLRISSLANLWGSGKVNSWSWIRVYLYMYICSLYHGKSINSWPVSSPEQLLLTGSVVSTQGFELCLSLLQLCQHLVLRVSSWSRSLLRVQQPLSHQLLFDPSLQRACVRNTGGATCGIESQRRSGAWELQ